MRKATLTGTAIVSGAVIGAGAAIVSVLVSEYGRSDYSILETRSGKTRTTYEVRLEDGTPRTRAEEIARELTTGNGALMTVVNFYDGPRAEQNLMYACQGTACYDAHSGK